MPKLADYDVVVINSSGGKDSQAMLTTLVEQADRERYSRKRLVVVHADLGRVEWEGTRDVAQRQAAAYGLRFIVVKRDQDLLDQVEQRGMWPSSTARYCTSDHKRDQVAKVFTRLVRESGVKGRPVRILNAMGLRAQESPARAKREEFTNDRRASNGKRVVDTWLPIFRLLEEDVWAVIERSGLPVHPAYGMGMPRLSCCFCVLAGKSSLIRAAQLNPTLAQTYVDLEARIGHTFRMDVSMADVVRLAAEAETPVVAENWAA